MKPKILIFLFLLLSSLTLKSQNLGMFAEVKINNVTRISLDSIQFELTLTRLTEDWHYYANSTFQLAFDTSLFKFDNSNLKIQRETTGLTIGVLTGNSNPAGGYVLSEQILNNNITLGILCPETIEESQFMPINTEFLLGKYTIYTSDKRNLPIDIKWIKPVNYYQKTAFKLENDSIVSSIKLFNKNDNLDLITKRKIKAIFSEKYLPFRDTLVLINFIAEYAGQNKMDISWRTKEELNNFGFMIKKALRENPLDNPNLLQYEVLYTCHKDSLNKFRPEMLSKGNTTVGFDYGKLPDTVEFRGVEYCYQLYCCRYDSSKVNMKHDIFLAQTCTLVPNSLIISAQIITENPFNEDITIEFKLADDCFLTIGSYDLIGKLIEKIKDKETGKVYDKTKMKLGTYRVTFKPMPVIASGSYYIYLIATPLDESGMDISKVVIKILNLK